MSFRYEDFDVRFEALGDGRLQARLSRSQQGTASVPFTPPFAGPDLDALMRQLDILAQAEDSERVGALEVARTLGTKLFQSLFHGALERALAQCLAAVAARENVGLRVRLQFDPRQHELAALARLPWELMRHPSTGTFLARSIASPITRSLDVDRRVRCEPAELPLRILVAAASPTGLAPLAVDSEHERIRSAWADNEQVRVQLLEHADVDTLRRELRRERWHVLHFIGHGSFPTDTSDPVLLFERSSGAAHHVHAEAFADTLADCAALRLVVLNACHAGALPRREGVDPFTTAAAALVARGIPAVLAMQFGITDDASVRFSEALYRSLASADPLDAAVAEGRLALAQEDGAAWDWAAPVILLAPGAEGALTLPSPVVVRTTDMLEPALQLLAVSPEEAYRLAVARCVARPGDALAHLVAAAALASSHPMNALTPSQRDALEQHLRIARSGNDSPLAECLTAALAVGYYQLHGRTGRLDPPRDGWHKPLSSGTVSPLEQRLFAGLRLDATTRKALDIEPT